MWWTIAVIVLALYIWSTISMKKEASAMAADKMLKQMESERKVATILENGYPEAIKDNFIKACAANAGGNKKFCSCVFNKMQERYTFQEFTVLEIKMQAGQAPQEFVEFMERARMECAKEI